MGIFDKIFSKRAAPASPQLGFIGTRNAMPMPAATGYLAYVRDGLDKNPVVSACVAVLSSTLTEAPLVVTTPLGDLIHQHPLTRLLRSPNATQPASSFWAQVYQYLMVGGNAYILKVRDGVGGSLNELWAYSDALVTPVYNDMGWVDGYAYVNGATRKLWPASDVIHLRNPLYTDPLNPVLGMSPIRVAWRDIQTYNEIAARIYDLAKNNLVPEGVLTAPNRVEERTIASLVEQIKNRLTGGERHVPLVLSEGLSYVQMGLDMQRLQVAELLRVSEASICGAFRVHPSVAMTEGGLARSTYSNLATAYAEYTTLTRIPLWSSLAEQMSAGFFAEYGAALRLTYDLSQVAALKPDPDAVEYPALASYNASVLTLNETRERLGYRSVDDGDVYAIDRVQPAPSFFAAPQSDRDGDDSATPASPVASYDASARRLQWEPVEAKRYWEAQERITTEAAQALETHAADMMAKLRVSVMGTRAKGSITVPSDAVLARLLQAFMNATATVRKKLFAQILELAVTSVGDDLAAVQSYIDEIEATVNRQVNDKIKESLGTAKREVIDLIDANPQASAEALREKLESKFTTLSTSRAKAIANTTAKAQTSTTMTDTWNQMNRRETDPKRRLAKAWLSRRDDRVRPSHEAMDGMIIDMDGEFQFPDGTSSPAPAVGGSGSEAINCRCTVRAVRMGQLQ